MDSLTQGQFLANYEIISRLGTGGMGEVYLARDTKLEREVAVKVLSAEVAANQERMRRFVQEAKAAAALNHSNIAHIYDIGQAPGGRSDAEIVHFIAMEFIDGQTLRQHMNRTKMGIGEVLDVSIQVANALIAAHAAGIVHRDIKPENIMRRVDGIMKVLDFGIAKLTETRPSPVEPEALTSPLMLTQPGMVMGTVAYMSPEQARGKEVDGRTDIFSLGVVIYEMLAGLPPFSGETVADQLGELLHKEPRLLELGPSTPPDLQHIVSKTLRKDREKRYQTMKSLVTDLVTLKQELDFNAKLKRTSHHEAHVITPPQSGASVALPQALESLVRTLDLTRAATGAISCTFYVRDPIWPDEFRLIAMPGVHFTEPMHGFSFPPHSKKVVVEGDTEIFSADTEFKAELREDAGWPLDQIDHDRRFLFGDFVAREGIKSSARLLRKVDDRIEAVLFVNFSETTTFDEQLKKELRDLLEQCCGNLPALQDELRKSETDDLIQAIRMFPPTYEGSTKLYEWDMPLESYLRSILQVAMAALDLEPGTAMGTIHAYERQTHSLRLAAHFGEVDIERAALQSVATGQGIISWVAIRRKALLIRDLSRSAFGDIHIPISSDPDREVKSEVAIPIFAGEDLLGVLNLESFLANAFRPMCVRSLWFAVNRAAVAHRLSSINDRIRYLIDRFINLCGEAVRKGRGGFSLNLLADLAAEELEAARCGIWHYDGIRDEFELAGISPADDRSEPPRPSGMSKFILKLVDETSVSSNSAAGRSAWPVWINRKEPDRLIEISYWNGETWDQPPSHLRPPENINPSVRNNVKSLLGIPIKGRFSCIGIAWLEYERHQETPPVNELMKLATGFADYAGLVIEFSQVDLVDQDAVQRIGAQLSEHLLAPGALKLERFPSIEGYAISKPFPDSRIGGDFYAARVTDEKTAVVIVGDGQGHAVTGALNMLPILTIFEAFWKESRSVTHIMGKIMDISSQLGVLGTAVCCVFTLLGKNLWLSVTSAGHPHLVIIKRRGGTRPYPPETSEACGPMLGVPLIARPVAEEHTPLASGDLIIIFTDGLGLSIDDVTQVGLLLKAKDSEEIAQAIFARAVDNTEPLTDDATVLVIRVK